MDKFLEQRKNAWQRLEDLLRLLDTSKLRKLNREEVRELGHSYRRAAADLAVARACSSAARYSCPAICRALTRSKRAAWTPSG